jgi:O-antigen ligase
MVRGNVSLNMNSSALETSTLNSETGLLATCCDPIVGVYWLVLTLKSTLFFNAPSFEGMYAPLYPFLVLGAVRGLGQARHWAFTPILTYGLFVSLSILAVLINDVVITMETARRLFTYGFGIVALLNLIRNQSLRFLIRAQAVAGATIAGWVVYTAWTTNFGYRSGIEINWNYASVVISFSFLGMAWYVSDNLHWWRAGVLIAILVLCLESYSLLLLASRGTAIALGGALPFLLVRNRRGKLIPFAIALVLLLGGIWGMTQLPGGNTLIERGTRDRVESLNFRLPIWEAVLTEFSAGSTKELLLGRGIDSGEYLVGTTVTGLGTLHNAYLQVLFEEGLLGLSAFLLLHIWCACRLFVLGGHYQALGLAVLVFLLIANLSGSNEHLFEYWMMLAATVAIALPAYRHRRSGAHALQAPWTRGSAKSHAVA